MKNEKALKIKKVLLLFPFLSLLIFLSSFSFADITIKTSKTSYLPSETLQLEIEGNFTKSLSVDNIFFYRNDLRLPTAVFLSKINDKRYFVWFDLPKEPGIYKIRVIGYCNQLCIAEKRIEIVKPVAYMYESLSSLELEKLPLKTFILASKALSYEDETRKKAESIYRKREDACINSYCSTENLALSILAFPNFREELTKKLKAYERTNKNLFLEIKGEGKCTFSKNNETTNLNVNKSLIINISSDGNINIRINCTENITARFFYSFENLTKEIGMKSGKSIVFERESKHCWGEGFKDECKEKETSLALLALKISKELDDVDKALLWLKNNSRSYEAKAVLYYLSKDNETLNELLNSQAEEGFWLSNNSLETTAFVVFLLRNEEKARNAVLKAEEWLKSKELPTEQLAFVLSFAFPATEIEPILSIWPGLIKTKSKGSFNLILNNKNIDTIVNLTLLNSTTNLTLKKEMKTVKFQMPTIKTVDGKPILSKILISYRNSLDDKTYFYEVPVIIFTEKSNQSYVGEINITEELLNRSKIEEIVNESKRLENETVNINESIISSKFYFAENNISVNLTKDTETIKEIYLRNEFEKDLFNIEISKSSNLIGFVEIVPNYIERLKAKEARKVILHIKGFSLGKREGMIKATASYGSITIETSIPIEIEVKEGLKSCSEMNGVECSDGYYCDENLGSLKIASDTDMCCVPASACKKVKTKSLGIAIIAFLIAILLILLILIKRKSKREMKDYLKEISEKYRTRTF